MEETQAQLKNVVMMGRKPLKDAGIDFNALRKELTNLDIVMNESMFNLFRWQVNPKAYDWTPKLREMKFSTVKVLRNVLANKFHLKLL